MVECFAANGQQIRITATSQVKMRIGNVSLNATVLAVKDSDCAFPMILGSDLMEEVCKLGHVLAFDQNQGTVTVNNVNVTSTVQGLQNDGGYVCASGGKALRVRLNVNNCKVEALFDTGCFLSFLSTVLARQLQLCIDYDDIKGAVVANGSRIFFIDSAFAKIQLRDRSIWHRVCITEKENCPAPFVMGTDLIRLLAPDHRIVLDFNQRKVRFADDQLDFINAIVDEYVNDQKPPLTLRVPDDVELQPRSDIAIVVEFCG